MKRFYYLVMVIVFSNNIYSQSWAPINSFEKYNYKISNSDTIACTIFVDSIRVIGSDSLLYLNTVYDKCDTCTCNNQPYTTAYSSGHSQFLKKVIKRDNNNVFTFSDTVNFYLQPYALLNTTWVFDSINNINAVVVNIGEQIIFGIVDSIKTIILSTGDTICLSKQFGIIQFPVILSNDQYYRLVGIEGSNLGLITPKANDLFNYPVGSIFQYKGGYGDPGISFYYIYQMTVLENLSQADTIKYRVQKIGKRYENPYTMESTGYFSYFDTITILNNSQNYLNSYTNNLISLSPIYYGANICCFPSPNEFKTLTSFVDSSGVLIRTTNNVIIQQYEISSTYIQFLSDNFDRYRISFVPGLGQVSFDYFKFEQGWNEYLQGYIINGDTTGNIYNSALLANISTISNNENFEFILDSKTNNLEIMTSSILHLSIYDVLGKLVYNNSINNKSEIVNLSFLKSGIYLIVLFDKNNRHTIKYLK